MKLNSRHGKCAMKIGVKGIQQNGKEIGNNQHNGKQVILGTYFKETVNISSDCTGQTPQCILEQSDTTTEKF